MSCKMATAVMGLEMLAMRKRDLGRESSAVDSWIGPLIGASAALYFARRNRDIRRAEPWAVAISTSHSDRFTATIRRSLFRKRRPPKARPARPYLVRSTLAPFGNWH